MSLDRRRKQTPARPKQRRNTVAVMLSVLPAEKIEFDALAEREAEPGFTANKSATFRRMLKHYLAAEERGELPRQRELNGGG